MESPKSSPSPSSSSPTPFPCPLNPSPGLPGQFVWSREGPGPFDLMPALDVPVIDLGGFLRGDLEETSKAIELVRAACTAHGFFQVIGHGVDLSLIDAAYDATDRVFGMPMSRKMGLRRKEGSFWGYSHAHSDRYLSNLPWKETFTFGFEHNRAKSPRDVVDYFADVVGRDFVHVGWACQKYCEAAKETGLAVMELIAMSLGVDREHYLRIFKEGSSIMRWNYYPPCEKEEETMGTGPHCDPTSLTVLHQDGVGGLQVLLDGTWRAVTPRHDAFVINIGDTMMAMTNGLYKSCLHRAVVNKEKKRRSLALFMCPPEDHLVEPPSDLLRTTKTAKDDDGKVRKYPDFKWGELLRFTQTQYRADVVTLDSFIDSVSNQTPPKSR